MIIQHEYSLSMVDHEGFVEYSNTLQPMFKVVSRNTIRSDILKMYKAEKVKAIKLIEDNKSRIAITTDMWTASNQKKGYMVVTAHYIDDSWILQSKILRFMYVPCPHNAETISYALMGCLMDWNVDRKLSTLTLDNCTTNDAAIPIMKDKLFSSGLMLSGDFFHMRCAAHILNLIVKDGMFILDKGIVNIRESVSYWTATTKRNEKFMETARQLHIQSTKVLALDMPVRWNSTYVMLSTALIYKSVFARLKQRESGYKTLPLDDDWVKARDLCDKLFLFYQAKFLKYWDVTHGIMAVASILDPRYKMKLIEYFFLRIYGERCATEIMRLQTICAALVREYKIKYHVDDENYYSSPVPSRSDVTLEEYVDPLSDYDLFVSRTTPIDLGKSELDKYLEEPVIPRSTEFDILIWWKTNGIKYPLLSSIARDILAIPVTTVASESAFSTGGRVVSPHCNRLHPKTLEALNEELARVLFIYCYWVITILI
ncbi:hypothetical protein UlMin_045842 [Ulmus minor]